MVSAILVIVAILVLILVNILLLSYLGAYFMRIAQGTTAFISAGDSLKEILPNVGGYKMSQAYDIDGRRWLIPEPNEEKAINALFDRSMLGTKWFQKLLWKKFGVKFISWFWPQVHVYWFNIRKGGRRRIMARSELVSDAPVRDRVVDSPEPTLVNSLLFLVPRPVYVEGAALAGDNSRINAVLLPVYRQVIPALPAYYLKGDFFTLLDAAIEAAVVDFFGRHRVAVYKSEGDDDKGKEGLFAANTWDPKDPKHVAEYEPSALTYQHWLQLTKAGEGSPLEQRLRYLNVTREYRARLAKESGTEKIVKYIDELTPEGKVLETPVTEFTNMIPSGIVPRFGFALISFRIIEWEPHSSTKPLAQALLAKETEFHAAEGVRQKAYGAKDAAIAEAEGDSKRYLLPVQALIDKGVDPNVAAGVVATQLRTENIRDSKLTTYVEGGASASVMVQASPPTPTK